VNNLLNSESQLNETYSFQRKSLQSHYSSPQMDFIAVFGANVGTRKPPAKTGGCFGARGEERLAQPTSFSLAGGGRPSRAINPSTFHVHKRLLYINL
jgi:hypothetical protein